MIDPIEVDGAIVLESDHQLSAHDRAFICAHAATAFPGRRVLVLDGGIRVSRQDQPNWAKRIEAKLDALIAVLAGEDADQPGQDLEGNQLPPNRPEAEEL